MSRLGDALDQLGVVEPTDAPLSAVDVEAIARRWTDAALHYRDSEVLAASADDVPDLIAEVQRLRGLIVDFTSSRVTPGAPMTGAPDYTLFPAAAYTALLNGALK